MLEPLKLVAYIKFPILATIGMDQFVSLIDISNPRKLRLVNRIKIRDIQASNDEEAVNLFIHSARRLLSILKT